MQFILPIQSCLTSYTYHSALAYWRLKPLRHFDTSHSSAHEGTNHGLKSHSAGVQARMDVDLSTQTMNTQTNIRVAVCEEFIFHDATCTHKKWSNLPTAPYTVTFIMHVKQVVQKNLTWSWVMLAYLFQQYFQVLFSPRCPLLVCKSSIASKSSSLDTTMRPCVPSLLYFLRIVHGSASPGAQISSVKYWWMYLFPEQCYWWKLTNLSLSRPWAILFTSVPFSQLVMT